MKALLPLALAVALLGTIPDDNVSHGVFDPVGAIDASCYGSAFRIGTGNVPLSLSNRASSVVNVWAELPPDSKTAIAWIAKTYDGTYWIQTNRRMLDDIYHAFDAGTARWLLESPAGPGRDLSVYRKMTGFTQYATNFARVAVLTPCFTHDLPAKYF